MTEWRKIPDFPAYEISEHGDVRRCVPDLKGRLSGKCLRPAPQHKGHLQLALCRDRIVYRVYVHRLVAITFIGPPPTDQHEAAHDDGEPGNNHWSNLKWKTVKENSDDRVRHGTMLFGERGTKAKLKEAQVLEIRRMRSQGISLAAVAAMFGISRSAVGAIATRKNWKRLA